MPEINYASRGLGVGGLTTGIIGSALGVLNGGLGNVFGGNANCGENSMVNRYELGLESKISEKDMEIAYLKGQNSTDAKLLELYKYVDGKLAHIDHELCDQRVFNATATSTISCLQGQIAQLMGLTKLVVPNASICPGWGTATVTVGTATTTA